MLSQLFSLVMAFIGGALMKYTTPEISNELCHLVTLFLYCYFETIRHQEIILNEIRTSGKSPVPVDEEGYDEDGEKYE